jgi:hypothetical protein
MHLKQSLVEFVDGDTWIVNGEENLPQNASGWWKVEKFEFEYPEPDPGPGTRKPVLVSKGKWFVNLDNVKGVRTED